MPTDPQIDPEFSNLSPIFPLQFQQKRNNPRKKKLTKSNKTHLTEPAFYPEILLK